MDKAFLATLQCLRTSHHVTRTDSEEEKPHLAATKTVILEMGEVTQETWERENLEVEMKVSMEILT